MPVLALATSKSFFLLRRVLNAKTAVDRRRAGDDLAKALDPAIRRAVERVLWRYGVPPKSDETEDMVADVWLALFDDDCRKLRRFDPTHGALLEAYVARIATNSAIDALRARRKKCVGIDSVPDSVLSVEPAPLAVEVRQRNQTATGALAELEPSERELAIALFQEERDPSQLAVQQGVTLNTIYSRKFRLAQKLRESVRQIEERPKLRDASALEARLGRQVKVERVDVVDEVPPAHLIEHWSIRRVEFACL